METKNRYATKAPSRGGARAGAGRKKGSSPRYTIEQMMTSLEDHTGVPFAERVAMNYAAALGRSDWSGIRDYDKILLGKLVADKTEIEVTESDDAVTAKALAFQDALAKLVSLNQSTK